MSLDPFLQQSQENVRHAQSSLAPGLKVFGGRFVLEKHLGQGGMGQVWLAQDTALDQPRALKFVLPALLSDAQARKRLRNEARLGTELAHPRIVRVFDFVEETGDSPLAAVVMEFVEGRTLSDLLAEKDAGFFEPEDIERWVQDVIEGLRYAHEEKQRYHLDLKPGNIMVETATGRAKVLDFGISRSAKDTMTRLTGQVSSGTLPYMSPQQLDGEQPCSADDVYGLGATVYELLTGTPPFFRGKLDDQIRSKAPESLTQRRKMNAREGLNSAAGGDLSSSWEQWVAAALSKEPHHRALSLFQTALPQDLLARTPSSSPVPVQNSQLVQTQGLSTDWNSAAVLLGRLKSNFIACVVAWWIIVAFYTALAAVLGFIGITPRLQEVGQWFLLHAAVLVVCMAAVSIRKMGFRLLTIIAVCGQVAICAVLILMARDDVDTLAVNACIGMIFFLAGKAASTIAK